MFLKSGDTVVSPWHDVPLHADAAKGLLNFICEIPKNTKAKARARAAARDAQRRRARCCGGRATLATGAQCDRRAHARADAQMEVATDEPNTPIKQDTKKGKLRDYP